MIVGGAVRDALLLSKPASKDVDIEVYGLSAKEALISALSKIGAVDERGIAFGVVAASVDGEDFDISFPRRDSVDGAGHRGFNADIDPGLDIRVAFGRRDFTINAIGFDPATEELVDPFSGANDLRAGVLRHTSDAFVEDPLRVLRGVQFAGRFGFVLAPDTATLCRTIVPLFAELSVERVWGEWRKLARRAVFWPEALTALAQTGWDVHFPELAATKGIRQDPEWHSEGDVWTHLGLAARAAALAAESAKLSDKDREVAVLGALVHDFGKVTHTTFEGKRIRSTGHAEAGVAPAKRFLNRIGAPHWIAERVLPIVAEHMSHTSVEGAPSPAAVKRLIRRLKRNESGASIYDWARVVDADCAGRGRSAKRSPAGRWLAVAEKVGPGPRPSLLRGEHLIERGLKPGPGFGSIIQASIIAQDDGVFDDIDGATRWLDEYLESAR
ncbi:CCA tRNA nucleotidyltransferase [Diaminobutyricibacter sp. McL0618]|uniref:CCA tRNA nucleotidyltransferase n=1 Tax=Leifsonia sp. McL0618 TaxID=3415677 RepID=UPI003CF1C511